MADDIDTFIEGVTPARRRDDARVLVDLMRDVTGEAPALHRGGIIGFGMYHYEYASGHSGDTAAAGFAPRKRATTVYLMDGIAAHREALALLGPHTTGVGCLYLTDLSAVDLDVLRGIVRASYVTLTSGTFGTRAGSDAT